MTVSYSVTFEFDTRPPVTHRGTVVAASTGTGTRRAVQEAQKVLKPVGWSSVVCVLDRRPAKA